VTSTGTTGACATEAEGALDGCTDGGVGGSFGSGVVGATAAAGGGGGSSSNRTDVGAYGGDRIRANGGNNSNGTTGYGAGINVDYSILQ
jgi:hypothetical protein